MFFNRIFTEAWYCEAETWVKKIKNHTPIMTKKKSISYAEAGVNIATGNLFVKQIAHIAQKTATTESSVAIGGFGSLFDLKKIKIDDPILVASTDGVGTKIKLAVEAKRHFGIGIDLVAMCVNDIITTGAKPLFFLDYFATARLDPIVGKTIIQGVAKGCQLAQCALIGGETAEMPGIYQPDDYDLAGFAVGAVERKKLITGNKVKEKDVLIALTSSGIHANGYSLVRRILKGMQWKNMEQFDAKRSLCDVLLEPTRIYVSSILKLANAVSIKAMAHITGGGITENLPRVLPEKHNAILYSKSWEWPKVFTWLKQQGKITNQEMLNTFNCGVGMIICVAPSNQKKALKNLEAIGEQAWVIGEVKASRNKKPKVIWKA